MKKLLLNEDVTRRFMKLANIEPLVENFIDEMVDEDISLHEEEEEALEPVEAPEEEPMPAPEGEDMDLLDTEDAAADPEAAEGHTVEVNVEELVDNIADAIHAATGVEVEREGAESADLPDDAPLDMSPEAEEAEAALAPSPEMGGEEAPMPPPEEEEEMPDDNLEEEFVNEVLHRVAKRLLDEASS